MAQRFAAVLVLILLLIGTLAPLAWADDTYVRGYTKRDGTYVAPHWRSAPDSSYNNNWSTAPNINPYTGQQGTRQPRLFDSNDSSSGGGYGSGLDLGGTRQKSRSGW